MNIWLINTAEPLPVGGANPRLLRTGLTLRELVKRGHSVTWWSSTFDHNTKTYRSEFEAEIELERNAKLKLLHSEPYKKNVSFERILSHRKTGARFSRLAASEAAPDVIVCSMPTIDMAYEAARYGQARGVPVIIDMRDMWPDIFVEVLPAPLRLVGRIALQPLFSRLKWACERASSITGITEAFVNWGIGYTGRARTDMDRAFPLAYPETKPDEETLIHARRFWAERGLDSSKDFIASFVGTFRPRNELDTIVEAARRLPKIKFVLAGGGEIWDEVKSQAKDLPNVIMPGWVDASQVSALLEMSAVGLAPYQSTRDYVASVPNKPIEYLSAGVPILTSLAGELESLINRYGCGYRYANRDTGALVKSLEGLSMQPEIRRKLSEGALSAYREHFLAEKVYTQFAEHIEHVGARRGRA